MSNPIIDLIYLQNTYTTFMEAQQRPNNRPRPLIPVHDIIYSLQHNLVSSLPLVFRRGTLGVIATSGEFFGRGCR